MGLTLPLPCLGPSPWSLTSGRQDRASGVRRKCNLSGRLRDCRRTADTRRKLYNSLTSRQGAELKCKGSNLGSRQPPPPYAPPSSSTRRNATPAVHPPPSLACPSLRRTLRGRKLLGSAQTYCCGSRTRPVRPQTRPAPRPPPLLCWAADCRTGSTAALPGRPQGRGPRNTPTDATA